MSILPAQLALNHADPGLNNTSAELNHTSARPKRDDTSPNQAKASGSYFNRASALELARRSLVGAPVYTVISILMLLGTPILAEYGWIAALEISLLVVLGVLRFRFACGFEHRYDRIGELAVLQFNILTALQSLTLGFLAAVVIWHYWATRDVVLTIVLSAACVAAGTSALSVRKSAHVIFLICVLLPFGISVFLVGGLAKALLIIGYLVLMAFLVQGGGQAKRSYIQQLRANYEAESARRWAVAEHQARKEFVSNMTHKIRTPINSIIGMTSLLLDENLEQRPRDFAAIVHQSGIALMNRIESIPGTDTAKTKTTEIDEKLFDLQQCVADVVQNYH